MDTFFDRFGILLIAIAILIVRVISRLTAASSDDADDPDATTDVPVQSVAEADAQAGEMPRPVSPVDMAARTAMQRRANTRKTELQTGRENGQAVQTVPPSKGPTKLRQQSASAQPARTAESSTPDRNKWMEGFDIRRAVVWSEILRPKFKEDEA